MLYREFTSEAVTSGHPDKVCDQIADALVDRYMAVDPTSKCAIEVTVKNNNIFILGEVKSSLRLSKVDYEHTVRFVLRDIGYTDPSLGFSDEDFNLHLFVGEQSPDINEAVAGKGEEDLGAGDQGIMFGYACNETPEKMPLEFSLATEMARDLELLRKEGVLSYLRPDGKTQITTKDGLISTIVISTQHSHDVSQEQIRNDLKKYLTDPLTPRYGEEVRILINPSGRFVVGGPVGDSGVTGRKLMCDTYGGRCRNGGGALSGKDPSKVDRSGAYMARNLALHILSAFGEEWKLNSCEVQLGYAIGYREPVSLGIVTEPEISPRQVRLLSKTIHKTFDLSPSGIIRNLHLRDGEVCYYPTSAYGHFGIGRGNYPWEMVSEDVVSEIRNSFQNLSSSSII